MARRKSFLDTEAARAFIKSGETTTPTQPTQGAIATIAIADIEIPEYQPRQFFDPQKLEELAESIGKQGILEPLLVRSKANGKYELVAGGRRYRAAKMVGLTEVPAIALELDDREALSVAIVENLQREDLNPVEETEGILRLLGLQLGTSVEEVPKLLYQLRHEAKKESGHNVMANSGSNKEESGHNVMANSGSNKAEPGHNVMANPESGRNVTASSKSSSKESGHNVMANSESNKRESGHNVMANSESSHQGSGHNVMASEERKKVLEVFDGLAISWLSFVSNRLPLLALPEDILEALRSGRLAYTKATKIAKVKNEEARASLLAEAIAQDLTSSQIQSRVRSLRGQESGDSMEVRQLRERARKTLGQVNKAKMGKEKQKKLKSLLDAIDELLS